MLSLWRTLVVAMTFVSDAKAYFLEPDQVGPNISCPKTSADFNRLTGFESFGRVPDSGPLLMTATDLDKRRCHNMCHTRPGCRSVAYNPDTVECRLYQVPATIDNTQHTKQTWMIANRRGQGGSGDSCCSASDCVFMAGPHGCDNNCTCVAGFRSVLNACLLDPSRGSFTDRVAGVPLAASQLSSPAARSVEECEDHCLNTPWCLALLFTSDEQDNCALFSGVATTHASPDPRVPGFWAFRLRTKPSPGQGFVPDGRGEYFKYITEAASIYQAHATCARQQAVLYPAHCLADVRRVFGLLNITADESSATGAAGRAGSGKTAKKSDTATQHAGASQGVFVGLDRMFHLQQLHSSNPVVPITDPSQYEYHMYLSDDTHRHDTPLYSTDGQVITDVSWSDQPEAHDFIFVNTLAEFRLNDVDDATLLPAVCQYVGGQVSSFTIKLGSQMRNVTLPLLGKRVYQIHGVQYTGGPSLPVAVTVSASMTRRGARMLCASTEPLLTAPDGLNRLVTCHGVVFGRFVHLSYAGDVPVPSIHWSRAYVYGAWMGGMP